MTLVGIADPQAQAGGNAVTTVLARLGGRRRRSPQLEPAPQLGFSGAAAIDGQGRLLGMVELKAAAAAAPSCRRRAIRKVPRGAECQTGRRTLRRRGR